MFKNQPSQVDSKFIIGWSWKNLNNLNYINNKLLNNILASDPSDDCLEDFMRLIFLRRPALIVALAQVIDHEFIRLYKNDHNLLTPILERLFAISK